jgi:hypothetical protein
MEDNGLFKFLLHKQINSDIILPKEPRPKIYWFHYFWPPALKKQKAKIFEWHKKIKIKYVTRYI